MKGTRLRVGDVFSVPLDDELLAIGQITATYGKDAYYVAIFGNALRKDSEVDLESVLGGPVAFLALSFDAKLVNGDWAVLANKPVADDVPLPAYKEMVSVDPDKFDVVDYSGKRRRPADARESGWLPNRKFVAPIRLEKAIRARHGVEPWLDQYADLEPMMEATTDRMFASS